MQILVCLQNNTDVWLKNDVVTGVYNLFQVKLELGRFEGKFLVLCIEMILDILHCCPCR